MERLDILIIGAGISGIGMACHLKMKHPERSYTILERRDAIGGTWDLFRYPGVRSDSDMFTFGYSFKPWIEERDVATGDAILNYLNEAVDEYGVREHIRFGRSVDHLDWCSERKTWVVTTTRTDDGATETYEAPILLTCTGYYDYAHGYTPDFAGVDDFTGEVVHPQLWPDDLDWAGKRVVVIGSGATAVTLVPAMAKDAAHVTMLQRSPTYIFSRPARDPIAQKLRQVLPERVAYDVVRLKNIGLQRFQYTLSRKSPERIRAYLLDMAREEAGPEVDVDTHFNPTYDPWDQRLCLIPDGDLFEALRSKRASVVTQTIDRFVPEGILLDDGEVLEADVVVTATGLELQFMGGLTGHIDGEEVTPNELVCYKGMMFSGVPNCVAFFGYTSASWTLKTDLTSEYVCRLLDLMDAKGYATFVPKLDDPDMPTQSMMANLASSGYVRRGDHRIPRQGVRLPWRNQDGYFGDYATIRWGAIEDGVLEFGT
jgi:cation diffusion facilitator CzcD-associated flavoprotein CzcO